MLLEMQKRVPEMPTCLLKEAQGKCWPGLHAGAIVHAQPEAKQRISSPSPLHARGEQSVGFPLFVHLSTTFSSMHSPVQPCSLCLLPCSKPVPPLPGGLLRSQFTGHLLCASAAGPELDVWYGDEPSTLPAQWLSGKGVV